MQFHKSTNLNFALACKPFNSDTKYMLTFYFKEREKKNLSGREKKDKRWRTLLKDRKHIIKKQEKY